MKSIYRRSFLKTASSALLAAPFASRLRGAENPSRPIHIGLIGSGRQGRSLAESFFASATPAFARIVATCDLDLLRAQAVGELLQTAYRDAAVEQEIDVYQYPSDILADSSIDAVVVATTDRSHASVTIAALEAGKDVYLEKPITFTVAEGQQLVRAVRSHQRIFQAGTQQRSSVYFRRVCELVRQGKLGQLRHIEVRLPTDYGSAPHTPMPVPENLDYEAWLSGAPHAPYTEARVHPQADFSRPGWMQVQDTCHGMITNWGTHMLDIALWGSGLGNDGPVRIEAHADYEDRGIWNVHTTIEASLSFPGGVSLDLVAIERNGGSRPGVRFVGSDGWAECRRGSFEASDRSLLRPMPKSEPAILPVSSNHYRDFLLAIRDRRDPIAPVEEAHLSGTYCLLIAIAARLGRPLVWDPSKENFLDDPVANAWLSEMPPSK